MKYKNYKFILFFLSIGYLIDFYDLTLFAVVRIPVLKSLGVPEEDFMRVGSYMFNAQALGLVLGGILSGIWSDKFGRLSAVRIGILIYSVAIITNAYVTDITLFTIMRFLAGIGLAGEFAASITLLSEILPAEKRGFASGFVYSFGIIGGMLAAYIGSALHWQIMFLIGGIAGIIILLARISFADSILFKNVKAQANISRGNLKNLILNKNSFLKVITLTLSIIPFWFMAFFINFSPEVAKSVGMKEPVNQSISLAFYFVGAFSGSYLFPYIAKLTASRKFAVLSALILMLCAISLFGLGNTLNAKSFYCILLLIGLASGYSGLFMVFAVESFGTNQRSTAASLISSMARCSLVGINSFVPWLAFLFSDMWIASIVAAGLFFIFGVLSLYFIKETSNKSMDFYEGLNENIPKKSLN
ncbi:MFS transporter [Fluviispira multicolorata]|uniref:MFS transporter n=1 Tax=Fluviispira multicolorata TaxID=2654512 RepID=A0A833JDQ2_9BACT|nr:MFS transporter [Fluviispira multicolorata]KAB8031035.1 MFS transporter [Fluviispira multicolorata]